MHAHIFTEKIRCFVLVEAFLLAKNYAVLSWRGCLRANTRTVRKGLNLTRGSLYIVRLYENFS